MGAPDERRDEGYTRITLEVPDSDVEFMDALFEYRNELARQQGKKVRKQWSRKMLAESFIAIQCSLHRDQFREMLDECGPIPQPPPREKTGKGPKGERDEKAEARFRKELASYVSRVLAWTNRNT